MGTAAVICLLDNQSCMPACTIITQCLTRTLAWRWGVHCMVHHRTYHTVRLWMCIWVVWCSVEGSYFHQLHPPICASVMRPWIVCRHLACHVALCHGWLRTIRMSLCVYGFGFCAYVCVHSIIQSSRSLVNAFRFCAETLVGVFLVAWVMYVGCFCTSIYQRVYQGGVKWVLIVDGIVRGTLWCR